jgi:hypothetical protein
MARKLACAALAVALAVAALSADAPAGGRAATPLRTKVALPVDARDSSVVMLELGLAATHDAAARHPGAVVRLRRPQGGAVEIGRISIVASGGDAQRYQFNLAPALKRLGRGVRSVEIEVAPVDRGGGEAQSALALVIRWARIVTR